MKRPTFRQSSRPAFPREDGESGGSGSVTGSPFSQQQILHLMKTEFARARRHGLPIACLLLEIDGLDELVRRHGAGIRGQVLAELARTIEARTRGADHLGMMAGGRCLLVLPHGDQRAAEVVAGRLRESIVEVEVEADDRREPLTLSVGIAACNDQKTLFFDTLVKQAETALDWALESGGDRTRVFAKDRFVSGPQPEDPHGGVPETGG